MIFALLMCLLTIKQQRVKVISPVYFEASTSLDCRSVESSTEKEYDFEHFVYLIQILWP